MPTGYTHPVREGTVTSFTEFAKICVRAMGVTILQRDDSSDAPLITRYEPNVDYHDRSLATAREKRDLYDARTFENWRNAMEAQDDGDQQAWRDRVEQLKVERARYEAMLDKVQAWVPPTEEHQAMKKFMVDQLTESIRFDCTPYGQPPMLQDVEEYKATCYERVERDIEYSTKARREEIERTATRNEWLDQFLASLPADEPTS